MEKIRDARWKKIITLILAEQPKKMLDIGCNRGRIPELLLSSGIEIYGIDICPENVEAASRKGIIAQQGDVSRSLPYKDNSFDVILAGEIIEHLNDTDYFLDEIYRILAKDGALILTTPNLASLENRLRLVLGRQPLFVDYNSQGHDHIRAYTKRALLTQLQQRGFVVEGCIGSFVPFFFYSLWKRANKPSYKTGKRSKFLHIYFL